jgi:hypothetical protein
VTLRATGRHDDVPGTDPPRRHESLPHVRVLVDEVLHDRAVVGGEHEYGAVHRIGQRACHMQDTLVVCGANERQMLVTEGPATFEDIDNIVVHEQRQHEVILPGRFR